MQGLWQRCTSKFLAFQYNCLTLVPPESPRKSVCNWAHNFHTDDVNLPRIQLVWQSYIKLYHLATSPPSNVKEIDEMPPPSGKEEANWRVISSGYLTSLQCEGNRWDVSPKRKGGSQLEELYHPATSPPSNVKEIDEMSPPSGKEEANWKSYIIWPSLTSPQSEGNW